MGRSRVRLYILLLAVLVARASVHAAVATRGGGGGGGGSDSNKDEKLFGSTCRVTNTNFDGRGSLRHCFDRASEGDAGSYLIRISKQLAGETIPIFTDSTDPSTCQSLLLRNPDAGVALKTVAITGPRDRVTIDATACTNSEVIFASTDISLSITNLKIVGGFDGINLQGTSSPGDTISESLTLNNVHVQDCTEDGVIVFDTNEITVTRSSFEGSGDDGFAVRQVFGLPGDGRFAYSFTASSFTNNGDEGLDVRGNTEGGNIELVGVTASNNGQLDDPEGDGFRFDGRASFPDRFLIATGTITASRFEGNGKNGANIDSLFLRDITASAFNSNGNGNGSYGLLGEEIIIESIRKSLFNGNGDSGIELESPAVAVSIFASQFNNNGVNGIELEIQSLDSDDAVIGSVERTSLKDNGIAAIQCTARFDPPPLRSDGARGSTTAERVEATKAAVHASGSGGGRNAAVGAVLNADGKKVAAPDADEYE